MGNGQFLYRRPFSVFRLINHKGGNLNVKQILCTRTFNHKSGGNSEEITRKDTLTEAENLFYDKCSSFGGNPSTGYIVVQILDMYGRAIKSETIDRLPAPEPEEA